jgi:hypothetical protein
VALVQRHLYGVLIKGASPAKVRYPGYYGADKCAAVNANYFNTRFRNDDPVSIVNEWLDRDSYPGVIFSFKRRCKQCDGTLPFLAGYPVYVVNATTVKRKKHPKSPQFHDMNAVLELLKKTA